MPGVCRGGSWGVVAQCGCVCAGGVLQGQFLDVAMVKQLKDMPTRKELMAKLGRLIRKVRASPPAAPSSLRAHACLHVLTTHTLLSMSSRPC